MNKTLRITSRLAVLALIALACGATAPLSTASPTAPAAPLRVVYVKDQDLWLWTEDGGKVALIVTGDVVPPLAISPDGQLVAFVRASEPFRQEIWMVGSDGSGLQRLVSADDLRAANPQALPDSVHGIGPFEMAWKPGTHLLYFNTQSLLEYGTWLYDDLQRVDADTQVVSLLLTPGFGGMFYLSPDSEQLAVVTPTSIGLANADGNDLRPNLITFPEVGTYSEYRYYPVPAWSPDSTFLRVAIPPADTMQEPIGPTSLWTLPADGSPATRGGGVPAIPFAWPDRAYSPDLERIAYVQSVGDPPPNQSGLQLAEADGSQDRLYAAGGYIRFLGWLGNSIFVYSIIGNDETGGMYFGTPGGDPRLVSTASTYPLKFQSVDAEKFLYVTPEAGTFELHCVTVEGVTDVLVDRGADLIGYDFSK